MIISLNEFNFKVLGTLNTYRFFDNRPNEDNYIHVI